MAEQAAESRASMVMSFNTLEDYTKTRAGERITSQDAEALKKLILNQNAKNDQRYEESKKEAGRSLYKGAALGLAGSTALYVADKLFGDFIPWHLFGLQAGGKTNMLPQIEAAPKTVPLKPITNIKPPRKIQNRLKGSLITVKTRQIFIVSRRYMSGNQYQRQSTRLHKKNPTSIGINNQGFKKGE
jgi:hypothetical protein